MATRASANQNGADYWSSIVTWFSNEGITFSHDELTELKTLDKTVLDNWNATTMYQGFDVRKLMAVLRKNYTDYMQRGQPREEVTMEKADSSAAPLVYSNQEVMMKDITFLIFLFATRGSSWSKIKNKSTGSLTKIMEFLSLKYNIVISARDNANVSLGPDVVTLPRIAACFPTKLLDYYHAGYGKALVTHAELGLEGTITSAILCSSFPCVIPQKETSDFVKIHLIAFIVAFKIDRVIHREDRKFTSLDKMFTFYCATFNTPCVPTGARREYLRKIGLLQVSPIGGYDITAAGEKISMSYEPIADGIMRGETGWESIRAKLLTL